MEKLAEPLQHGLLRPAEPELLPRPTNWLATILLAAAFVGLFFYPLRELVIDWSIDPNYEHGFLIPFISGYLIWQKRAQLRQASFRPEWAKGFVFLALAMLLFILATATAEWFLARISMLLALYGIVICFGGLVLFRTLAVPLLYLGFMIPLPYVLYHRLTFPLQQISSYSAFQVMSALGLAGLREGNILHFQDFSLEVIEACSGLRSIMVLLALSALIAYLASLPNIWRWFLFAAAVPVAIVANVFRLVILGFLGIFWDKEVVKSLLHEGSGVIVFVCGLFLLIGMAGVLQWFSSRKHIG